MNSRVGVVPIGLELVFSVGVKLVKPASVITRATSGHKVPVIPLTHEPSLA